MVKGRKSGALISVRQTALDKARALLGVSKGEFEGELESHRRATARLSQPLLRGGLLEK